MLGSRDAPSVSVAKRDRFCCRGSERLAMSLSVRRDATYVKAMKACSTLFPSDADSAAPEPASECTMADTRASDFVPCLLKLLFAGLLCDCGMTTAVTMFTNNFKIDTCDPRQQC